MIEYLIGKKTNVDNPSSPLNPLEEFVKFNLFLFKWFGWDQFVEKVLTKFIEKGFAIGSSLNIITLTKLMAYSNKKSVRAVFFTLQHPLKKEIQAMVDIISASKYSSFILRRLLSFIKRVHQLTDTEEVFLDRFKAMIENTELHSRITSFTTIDRHNEKESFRRFEFFNGLLNTLKTTGIGFELNAHNLVRIIDCLNNIKEEKNRNKAIVGLIGCPSIEVFESFNAMNIIKDKDLFFDRSVEDKIKMLEYAVSYRDRNFYAICKKIIEDTATQDPYPEKMVLLSLNWIEAIQYPILEDHFLSLLKMPFADIIKIAAMKAMCSSANEKNRMQLLACRLIDWFSLHIENVSESVYVELICSIQKLEVRQLPDKYRHFLIDQFKKTLKDKIKIHLALLFSQFLDESCLLMAWNTIRSSVWDGVDRISKKPILTRKRNFAQFSYKPLKHYSRNRLKNLILSNLVLVQKQDFNAVVTEEYKAYKAKTSRFCKEVDSFHDQLLAFEVNRFIETPLFLPENSIFFRGTVASKESALQGDSIIDFFSKGCGRGSLHNNEYFSTNSWFKVGQVFATHELDYIIQGGFFNETLIGFSSDYYNEATLMGMTRNEKENSFHQVFYEKVRLENVEVVFIDSAYEKELTLLASLDSLEEVQKKLKIFRSLPVEHLSLIRKNLQQKVTNSSKEGCFFDRIVFFDKEQIGLVEHYKSIEEYSKMVSKLKEMIVAKKISFVSQEAFIEENMRRYIAQKLVQHKYAFLFNRFSRED